MFQNFPIQISTHSMSTESLLEQIQELKDIFSTGVTYDLLNVIVINSHNGMPTGMFKQDRNSFDKHGWVKHYKQYSIEVNEEQIDVVFKYLIKYYNGLLQRSGEVYTLFGNPRGISLQLEFLVLKTLE